MTVAERLDPFVGRATEVATLRAELAAARAGTPRVLVVQGDAGIGKTVLLEQFLADETDLTVLRATGEQWEAYVAYGVIDQIMRVAGVSTTRLLVSRDRSFPPEEPVGVGAWILDVIKELAQEAPVVVIVDDAHWADMDSLRALLFAARRWVDERVLLVLGQRTEDEQRLPEGLRRLAGGRTGLTLALQPLPPSDVHELASALGVRGFSTRAAQRLHAHTGGNALYVKTMLSELPEKRWRTWNPSLPAPRAFTSAGAAAAGGGQPADPGSRGGGRGARHHRVGGARPPRWPGCPTSSPRWTRRPWSGCCRCARTSASARSASRTRWCRPRCTSSSGRCAGCSCTRRRPSSSRTRARCCGTGCSPPPRRTRSWPRSWRRSPGARPRSARGRARRGRWSRAATSAPTGRRASSACCSRSTRRSARATCTRPRSSPGTSPRSAGAPGATPRSATSPSCAAAATRPRSCWATPGGCPPTTRTPRWPRWWPSGGACTPSDGCAATRWSAGPPGRSSWPDPATRCGSRPRRCSGWAWAGRGRSPRAWRPTRSCWAGSTRPRTARSWSASAWRTAGCGWCAATWSGHARRWR